MSEAWAGEEPKIGEGGARVGMSSRGEDSVERAGQSASSITQSEGGRTRAQGMQRIAD